MDSATQTDSHKSRINQAATRHLIPAICKTIFLIIMNTERQGDYWLELAWNDLLALRHLPVTKHSATTKLVVTAPKTCSRSTSHQEYTPLCVEDENILLISKLPAKKFFIDSPVSKRKKANTQKTWEPKYNPPKYHADVKGKNYVLCGRGNYLRGAGKRYVDIVYPLHPDYANTTNKRCFVAELVEKIKETIPDVCFVAKDGLGRWYEISDSAVIDKVHQAVRSRKNFNKWMNEKLSPKRSKEARKSTVLNP
jgi:hypothetical protein